MNQFFKKSEAKKKSPVINRPDLVAQRNAELTKAQRKEFLDPVPTDSRVFFRRPDLSCYAVLSMTRIAELRKLRMLDVVLNREKNSLIIIPTETHDDPHRDRFDPRGE